ncbi:MAG: hypothetical protein ACJ71H_00315 [Nitrososphaeraceae archaeon]
MNSPTKTFIDILAAICVVLIGTSCIAAAYAVSRANAAAPSISLDCGPTQESNHSISIRISGFLPNAFVYYKYIRSDNSTASGGFSAGTLGQNTVAINAGPYVGLYRFYIYKDINSFNTKEPTYSSTISLPCKANHFTTEYYKNHPQRFDYVLGIKSISDKLKIGDYLVASPGNVLNILNLSNSKLIADQLAAQLLAAELNSVVGGPENCINGDIYSANAILKTKNYNGPTTNILQTTTGEDSQMLSLKNKIRKYNKMGCE